MRRRTQAARMRSIRAYRGLSMQIDPPLLVSATIAADGLTWTLVFSEAVTGLTSVGVFTYGLLESSGPLTYSSGEGTNTGVFTDDDGTAYSSEPATITYAPGTVANSALVPIATIANRTASNNSTVSRSLTYNGDTDTTFSTVGKTAIVISCWGGGGIGDSTTGGGGGGFSGATTYAGASQTLTVGSAAGDCGVSVSAVFTALAHGGLNGDIGGAGGAVGIGSSPVGGGAGGTIVGGGGGCGNGATGNGNNGVLGISAGAGGGGANGGGNGGNGSLLSDGGNGGAPGAGGGASASGSPGTGQPTRIVITWNYL